MCRCPLRTGVLRPFLLLPLPFFFSVSPSTSLALFPPETPGRLKPKRSQVRPGLVTDLAVESIFWVKFAASAVLDGAHPAAGRTLPRHGKVGLNATRAALRIRRWVGVCRQAHAAHQLALEFVDECAVRAGPRRTSHLHTPRGTLAASCSQRPQRVASNAPSKCGIVE
ncbi:hypothetical protein TraAM80_09529 [Trypanosoma rangeli]|uniref:Secreted protein n=1 Tax=Trypanosoma rangeli TaxID=5698 RepID=A0A422MVM2_TRYRA|nr:uncharacterized protein TraAM80_09529 [Trypanosoma rangeli]RNE97285.1 hypothetical protein TraAM80_09529 [Trypanosoma rangeli]|eukprot:RNE97285.1 hypothetical protein TraAM80_09529 [Trypanosoma rangeli]